MNQIESAIFYVLRMALIKLVTDIGNTGERIRWFIAQFVYRELYHTIVLSIGVQMWPNDLITMRLSMFIDRGNSRKRCGICKRVSYRVYLIYYPRRHDTDPHAVCCTRCLDWGSPIEFGGLIDGT